MATSSFSIFGEWSGNVRSTPTPNDCLRTVNVSRTPGPCRLMTMPSKTCTRRRWPSITWKRTRTVSPALNLGRSVRSWRCSRLSITFGIVKKARRARLAMVAHPRRRRLREADALRRPIDGEDLADHVVLRKRPPHTGIARLTAVVAHDEDVVLRHLPGAALAAEPVLGDVARLVEGLAVDPHLAVAEHRDGVARQADDALHEGAACPALLLCALG